MNEFHTEWTGWCDSVWPSSIWLLNDFIIQCVLFHANIKQCWREEKNMFELCVVKGLDLTFNDEYLQ